MSMQLPPDINTTLQSFLVEGRYEDEADVLREALIALKRSNEKADLIAIQEGIEDMEAGRVRPFEEADADIRKKYGISDD